MTTYTPAAAAAVERAALVRPADDAALQALTRLALDGRARVERGRVMLAGIPRNAYLAVTPDGRTLAAVVVDEGNEGDNGNEGHAADTS